MSQTKTIVSKSVADYTLKCNPTARRFPYCAGKYSWTGFVKEYLGKPVERVHKNVLAIYVERRVDKDGPYAKMLCITTD